MTDFKDSAAKIIAEIRNRTCIDEIDTEALEYILQDALKAYYFEGYDDGHSEGRSDGYYDGYDTGHSDGYYEGYDDGYDEVILRYQ